MAKVYAFFTQVEDQILMYKRIVVKVEVKVIFFCLSKTLYLTFMKCIEIIKVKSSPLTSYRLFL